jgi:hypothetical protein
MNLNRNGSEEGHDEGQSKIEHATLERGAARKPGGSG